MDGDKSSQESTDDAETRAQLEADQHNALMLRRWERDIAALKAMQRNDPECFNRSRKRYQMATESVIQWIKWSDHVTEINVDVVRKMISFATDACKVMWESLCALRAARQNQQQQQQATEHQMVAQSGGDRGDKI